jgi:hypothetical protein
MEDEGTRLSKPRATARTSTEMPDFWLEGGVIPLSAGAERGFLAEVDRVIDLLGHDASWLHWWRGDSKAPALELQIFVTRPVRSPEAASARVYSGTDERVVRGRRRHRVRMHVDFDGLAELEADERRRHALPAVLEGISRARQGLKLTVPPPPVPAAVEPAPLAAGVLRRRRLRELLGASAVPGS